MKKHILGIDIGGTKCAVVLGDPKAAADSLIEDKIRFDTAGERGVQGTLGRLFESIDALMERNGLTSADILCAGISCGGPLDSGRGVVLSPPNLPGWDRIEITDMIKKRFGIKAKLQNDANACAVAEWKLGAGRGLSSLVFLTFGTGLGAGLILDGRLYSGCCDMAGEVGHIRLAQQGPEGYGKRGSFEGFCSGGGIRRLAQEMAARTLARGESTLLCADESRIAQITAKSVALAAQQGDETALEVYRICGAKLGEGLAVLIDLLNPQAIIIGSIFTRSENLLRGEMEKSLRREALPAALERCRIMPAALGDRIGDFAALGVALDFMEREGENEQD